jgi:hypothetical protein
MALALYALCVLTALLCSGLLLRGYVRNRVRLLLWAGLCFAALALENVILVIDFFVVPTIDLEIYRLAVALVGLMVLLYGLLWESRSG